MMLRYHRLADTTTTTTKWFYVVVVVRQPLAFPLGGLQPLASSLWEASSLQPLASILYPLASSLQPLASIL